jgi:hypothetical protein
MSNAKISKKLILTKYLIKTFNTMSNAKNYKKA